MHIRPANDGMPHKLNIPLNEDVNTQYLADTYEFAGREIRNAVINACVTAAMKQKNIVTQVDFIKACDSIVKEKDGLANASDHTLCSREKDALKQVILDQIKERNDNNVSTVAET